MADFALHFTKTVVEVKTSGQTNVIQHVPVGVKRHVLNVKYFCSNTLILWQLNCKESIGCNKVEVNVTTLRWFGYNQTKDVDLNFLVEVKNKNSKTKPRDLVAVC